MLSVNTENQLIHKALTFKNVARRI